MIQFKLITIALNSFFTIVNIYVAGYLNLQLCFRKQRNTIDAISKKNNKNPQWIQDKGEKSSNLF